MAEKIADKIAGQGEARPDEITIDMAGRLLEISAERVRQLIKEGYIQKTRHGFTTTVSAVRGYIKFLKEVASNKTATASASRAQEARAKEIERRMAREDRELISQEEAMLAMSQVAAVVSKELSGFGARVTRDMDLRRKIEDEAHGAQARIADEVGKLQGALKSG